MADKAFTFGDTIIWAQNLDDHDLKWHLMLLADNFNFHSDWHRKSLMHEVISRMGL